MANRRNMQKQQIKQNIEDNVEKTPIVPLEKLVGNYIHINELTTFKYVLGIIKLDTFNKKNKQMVITDKMDVFDIENAISHNLLFISDKKGKDITKKFYKNYKPSKLHIWKNPKSISVDPRESELAILLDDSLPEEKFLRYVDNLSEEDIVLLYNLFNDVETKTYLQGLKWKNIKRLFEDIQVRK